MRSLRGFGLGFQVFWSSFAILRKHRALKKLVYMPVAISIVFFVLSIFILAGSGTTYLMSLIPLDPGVFYWIIYSLFFIFSFLFSVLITFIFANVVSMPFNVALSEKYLKQEYQFQATKHSLLNLVKMILYFSLVGLVKALILLGVAILCFVLSFFPVLSLLAAFIGLMIVAFDCCDVAFELLEFGLAKRFAFVKRHFWPFVGFTTALSIVAVIPGFNFIFLPFMVLSASELVYKLEKGV